ncbi:MAG: recombinase family protein [Gemmataceae bacterium]
MSHTDRDGLRLEGTGAAYIRVSSDKQEVDRQLESIATFEKRHGVSIAHPFWFKDEGWARDTAEKRPDFQRMMKLAQAGQLGWIVADRQDRFGTKDKHQFMHYMYLLREAGCKFITCDDKVWTDDGMMPFFEGGMGAESSQKEQINKADRSLSGMVTKARAGEWMGGAPPLGFDVGCFDRASGAELWRVVYEGRDETRKDGDTVVRRVRRRKEYPDGRTERLDGNSTFRTSKDSQVMRLTPTKDAAKLDAVRGLFRRYAEEAVTFFDLAKWLNGLGIRNSFGKKFQGCALARLLSDEVYLGFPSFNKRRAGKFKRYDSDGGVIDLDPKLRGKDVVNDPADVIRSNARLFDPLIDPELWAKVQAKLQNRTKQVHAPRTYSLYFSGLLVCKGCGRTMIGRNDSAEYFCATWNAHRTRSDIANSPCERNPIKHAVVEEHVERYLAESGKRLELLTGVSDGDHITDRLRAEEGKAWVGFRDGINRLTGYLAANHPAEYAAIVEEHSTQRAADEAESRTSANSPNLPSGTLATARAFRAARKALDRATKGKVSADVSKDDFVEACVACYRAHFDPAKVAAQIAKEEDEYDDLMKKWADLPTPRAREKAKERFLALEASIEELKQQQQDAAEVVSTQYREMVNLQTAIADARLAMKSENGERALRQRAEALRGILLRIDCEFVSTGTPLHGGPKGSRSKPIALTFCPILGSVRTVKVEGGNSASGKPIPRQAVERSEEGNPQGAAALCSGEVCAAHFARGMCR